MNFYLIETGYVLDKITNIWSRPSYAGIAYSDGDEVERRIATIVEQASDITVLSTELRLHCTDWPSLYHLSGTRANILRPFEDELRGDILEIGAGCGAITRYLGECGGNVLALEGSSRRATIARNRTRDLPNVTVVAEKFDDLAIEHQFDIITLIGVLEYANLFTTGDHPTQAMLARVKKLLKPAGKLIIAIENQLGLKYFAGAPEDHIGQPMYGIEGRYRKDQPETFGKKVIEQMLKESDFAALDFYAPFPDYKLPTSIVTKAGFESNEFDAAALISHSVRKDPQLPPILAFSPELAWPSLVKNGLAMDMANSFLIVAHCGNPTQQKNMLPLAWHYSTDRKKQYCKETVFVLHENERIRVYYKPLSTSGVTAANDKLLRFSVPDHAPYFKGELLSQEFIQIVIQDQWSLEEVVIFFKKYLSILAKLSGKDNISFSIDTEMSGEFFDRIPQNIIIKPDDNAYIIDNEWALNEKIQIGFLVFRAILTLFFSLSRMGRPIKESESTYGDFILNVWRELGWEGSHERLNIYAKFETDIQILVSGRQDLGNSISNFLQSRLDNFFNLNSAVIERDNRIASLGQAVTERDRQIANLNQAVTERDEQLGSMQHQLREAYIRIQGLETSRSWRITKPLRASRVLLRKSVYVARVVRSYWNDYSLAALTRKTQRILLNEGLGGIKARILYKHAQLQRQPAVQAVNQQRLPGKRYHRIPSQSYADLLKLDLVAIDVLSLDVFDTAIIRLYDSPEGIFEYVGQALGKQSFISVRVQAENKAREQNAHRKDISLESIYRNLNEDTELESAAELMFCVANPEVYEIYRRALAAGKKVLFISDMYLPKTLVEEILQCAGYSVYERLYISSDDDLIKGDGSRYESLKETYPGVKFLHIGDNYVADVHWSAQLGMKSHHYSSAMEFYQSDQLVGSQYQQLSKDASIGIRYLLGVYRYWKYGFKTTTTSFWRDVGFFYSGPLLHAFSVFLHRQLAKLSSNGRVYFLARDGRVMKAVYEILYGKDDDHLRYLFASRRCMTFPLLSLNDAKLNDKVLDQYSLCEAQTTAQSVFDMLGYPQLEQFKSDLFNLEQKGGGSLTTRGVRTVIKKNLADIRIHACEEADMLFAYLDNEQFFKDKPVLVDVGWSGTIQDSIDALLEARLTQKPEIHGVYLGTQPNAADSERKTGLLFDTGSPMLAERILHHYVDFIELLTASDEDGIQRMVECDGQFQPSYQQTTEDEELRKSVSRQIQMGACEYACLVKAWNDKNIPVLTPQDFATLFDTLRCYASQPVITEFDAVKHSRIVGGPHSHNIIYFDRRA